jgi:outer membrane lipoprotein SlyB
MNTTPLVTLMLAGTVALGGCATSDPYYDSSYGAYDGSRYDRAYEGPRGYNGWRSQQGYYGVVESIEGPRSGSSGNAVAGTIIGGIVGGVIGHQIGSGTGNTVATVAGAAGGAAVGHEIGQNADRDQYRVRVRFDNGTYQTLAQNDIGRLRVGDRVRIENDRVYLN